MTNKSKTTQRITAKPQPQQPVMMTITQLAQLGILPASAIRNLVTQGDVPCVKSGNKVFINKTVLFNYLNRANTQKGA